MHREVALKLIHLNCVFYQDFGAAFAATRRRIQPGVRRVMGMLPAGADCLDLGCGSGALAAEWLKVNRSGSYMGLDFSGALLDEARRAASDSRTAFLQADLAAPDWDAPLAGRSFDAVLALAVLHHLPGAQLRLQVLREVWELLKPGAFFVHSEWQFQHSPRLMARVQPWDRIDLSADDVEPGDTLLDWRYALPGQVEQIGLRYVHLFTRVELSDLARAAGFEIRDEFESDGEGGRLGLYQIWQRI